MGIDVKEQWSVINTIIANAAEVDLTQQEAVVWALRRESGRTVAFSQVTRSSTIFSWWNNVSKDQRLKKHN